MKSSPKSPKSHSRPNTKTKLLNSQFKHDVAALKAENLKLQRQIAKLKAEKVTLSNEITILKEYGNNAKCVHRTLPIECLNKKRAMIEETLKRVTEQLRRENR
jgi:hypothetical protein